MEDDILFEDIHGPGTPNSPIFLLDPFIGCKNSDMESYNMEFSDIESSGTEFPDTELDILFEDIHGHTFFKGPIFLLNPFMGRMNSEMESSDTEIDQSVIKNRANNHLDMEINPCLVEKDEDKKQGSLFAPFSHRLKPDPEYDCLVSERLVLNQEATTKLINDRYKWIMESAAIRKVKELSIGKYTNRSGQYSKLNDSKEVEKTNPFLGKAIDDTEKTTQSLHNLHNLHITPNSFTKDNLEEASINQHEVAYELNRFLKLKAAKVNTEVFFSNFDVLKTVTLHQEHRVEDALMSSSNEQKDGEKLTLKEVDNKKYTETSQTFYEGINSVCDNHLIEKCESHSE